MFIWRNNLCRQQKERAHGNGLEEALPWSQIEGLWKTVERKEGILYAGIRKQIRSILLVVG